MPISFWGVSNRSTELCRGQVGTCKGAELLDDNRIGVKALLGLVSQCLGQLEEAMGYYLKVLEMEPDHNDALINLGVIYQGAGERENAQKLYERALGRS